MLHTIILAALVPAMAFLHRLRGGGFFAMPVKGTYILWPLVGLLAYAAGASWQASIAWAVGYLIWIWPAWMVFLTDELHATVPADQVMAHGWDVSFIDAVGFGNPLDEVLARASVFLVPLFVGLAFLGTPVWPLLIIAAAFLPAYWIGFKLSPTNMSAIAEPIVGASWGLALLLSRIA